MSQVPYLSYTNGCDFEGSFGLLLDIPFSFHSIWRWGSNNRKVSGKEKCLYCCDSIQRKYLFCHILLSEFMCSLFFHFFHHIMLFGFKLVLFVSKFWYSLIVSPCKDIWFVACFAEIESSTHQCKTQLSLYPFGIALYKFRGSVWTPPGATDRHDVLSLQMSSDNWLRRLRVRHPDYEYFMSKCPPASLMRF